jgi:endonuclease/exonuclease/phosphatase family metal-dependent hydrolase
MKISLHRIRWTTRAVFVGLLVLLSVGVSAGQNVSTDRGYPFKVVTQNLYQGTDFAEAMAATSFADFTKQVQFTIQSVRDTKPPLRMATIAAEIADQEPDLVALQEATVWSTGPSPSAMTVEFDMLRLLLQELKRLGSPYIPVNVVPQFMFLAPGTNEWVGTTTQIAILVRADRDSDDFETSNPQGGVFPPEHTLTLTLAPLGQEVAVKRGWASIDVSMKGREFRFITAHPEAFVWQYEVLQVGDLLQGPAVTNLPVIMSADFNMQADRPTDPTYAYSYQSVIDSGFVDAWTAVEPDQPGFTCCQLNNLTNPTSLLDQRIDLVFVRGPFSIRGVKIIGSKPDDRVQDLWPSDHAGLVSKLRIVSP